ncbi:MAG: SH3 domain-containing protein [Shinella sp.]|uniref:SH3 domain-containing protein n=1 Tax=Shinella sp. TaxID=1870904 RepID=UPI004037358E
MTSFLRMLAVSACLSVAFAFPSAFAAGNGQCLVDDPTGTALNVRSAPNGTILMTLANGTAVEVVDEMRIGTKHWLFVARQGERLGWIFGAYVVCKQAGDTREAAPSQPAEQR